MNLAIDKWDRRFIGIAESISTWSKDPSTQVGAVIVDRNQRIVSLGYNGFARGVNDYSDRYEDRDTKYNYVVHAEMNAILFAKRDLTRCILYTYPFLPCSRCAAMVIQTGIALCVSYTCDTEHYDSLGLSDTWKMLEEARVGIRYLQR